jgi:hypothetical protein
MVREAMPSEGAVMLLVSLLKAKENDLLVGLMATLNNVLYNSSRSSLNHTDTISVQNKRQFVREGGLVAILDSLQPNLEDSKIIEMGTLVLRNLCCNSDPYAPIGGKNHSKISY